ncbi:MAG: lytic transglycosylase domain-containing protein [Betaproteobacteria bacterium]|nr:MAG: lytic transglycosylase domain-containing protein [Betaproteobacteria bacterium]
MAKLMTLLVAAALLLGRGARADGDQLDAHIRAVLQKFGADVDGMPPDFSANVRAQRDAILRGTDARVLLQRKSQYWPMISKQLSDRSLPPELGYVVWVESDFEPGAKNTTSAGLWQFTATTARRFGLRVDPTVDERLDPEKSTRAAADYLAKLMSEFGPESFMLSLAGYNMGESMLRQSLQRVAQTQGGLRNAAHDFWHLWRMKLLSDETRSYVPRVIAAAVIGGHLDAYGFDASGR